MPPRFHNTDFRDLKAHVGIDDVAYALGYRLNRRAGVGRYIELVLGEDAAKRDTIIVSHPRDKAWQSFFRRDGSRGDVVTLIKENLDAFTVSGRSDWEKVAKVLSRFANMPEPDYREEREYVKAACIHREFDPSRYDARPINPDLPPRLFSERGFSDETVLRFAPFIRLVRDTASKNFISNVGFPYTEGFDDTVRGYELRGSGGFKSKAAGTNSSTAAWVVDLSENRNGNVRNVFFCESAMDAMAFYQVNRLRIGGSTAVVSLGGTFSDGQIAKVMERFPGAKAFDCFDNDIAGRIYGLRLLGLMEKIPIKVCKSANGLLVESGSKRFVIDPFKPLYREVGKQLSVRYRMGQWRPPADFKDWNDCLLGKRMEPKILPSKLDRDENLAARRDCCIKP